MEMNRANISENPTKEQYARGGGGGWGLRKYSMQGINIFL